MDLGNAKSRIDLVTWIKTYFLYWFDVFNLLVLMLICLPNTWVDKVDSLFT